MNDNLCLKYSITHITLNENHIYSIILQTWLGSYEPAVYNEQTHVMTYLIHSFLKLLNIYMTPGFAMIYCKDNLIIDIPCIHPPYHMPKSFIHSYAFLSNWGHHYPCDVTRLLPFTWHTNIHNFSHSNFRSFSEFFKSSHDDFSNQLLYDVGCVLFR